MSRTDTYPTDPTRTPVPPRATPMPVLTEKAWRERLERVAAHPAMRADNITLPEGAGATLSTGLLFVGLIALVLTVLGAFVYHPRHALGAFEIGLFTATAMSLGAMFFVMAFHSVNAGWAGTVRRQFENVASVLWVCWAMLGVVVVIELASGGVLLDWLRFEQGEQHLVDLKRPYLTGGFFVLRFFVYGMVWNFISRRLFALSRAQDESGDRMLTRKARFMSGWGLLAFALTTAFFAFDFLMSTDFRFFSTMWGVYYFASTALASVSVVVLILAVLRTGGRLTGAVTEEHFHDLGKLMLAFTVFWSYVAFSQYFLIWYSNIPEETAWFVYRQQTGGYMPLFLILCFGHFVVPFCILLLRKVKRSTPLLAAMGVYMILITIADMVWIVRPMVYAAGYAEQNPGMGAWWLDAAGIASPLCLWGFFLVRRVASGPLVPLKDPTMHESLNHVNYV